MKVTSIYTPDTQTKQLIPLVTSHIPAGFPSPADDFVDLKLDLNEHMVKHPAATFFVKVSGDSMIGAGIHDDDILVVDRSVQATNNSIIVAALHGELMVKRYKIVQGKTFLYPENTAYKPVQVTTEMEFAVWGVVTYVIHKAV
ncbi:MAG: LexA family protein [Weeksellaceae bacterium]